MKFSSSLSFVDFYFLKRFPIPYALYLMGVSVMAVFWGQCLFKKLVTVLEIASIIVLILSLVIFSSALTMVIHKDTFILKYKNNDEDGKVKNLRWWLIQKYIRKMSE